MKSAEELAQERRERFRKQEKHALAFSVFATLTTLVVVLMLVKGVL